MKKISVIVPMYYEQEVAMECYRRIKSVLIGLSNEYEHEIIFVNDGSKDNTLDILKNIANEDKFVKVISFSRNFGHQAAVMAGIRHCSGDVTLIIDADMQDPPELMVEMLNKWKEGYKIVYAKRKKRKGESPFKLFTAKMFYKALNNLSNVDIPKDTGDFRLVDKEVVDVVKEMPEHNKFLRGLFSWVGYKQTPIEYERQARYAGKTKYPLGKMLKLATDGIIGFSTKPLKMVGIIGIFSILLSILILIYSLLSYFLDWNNLTAGWTSIMVTVTFFAGVQLMSLWIMSEYIARIYDESKGRPEYIIEEKINF